MQNERALCTDCLNISIALSMTSTQLALSSSSTTMWEAHPELHRGKRSNIKNGIPKERGLVCTEIMSKSVLHVINCQSWASQERLCKYFFCSTKETNLFDPPCCSIKAAMFEENWDNDGSILIYLPSSTFHFRFSKSSCHSDAKPSFSGLATCGRGHLQYRKRSCNFC